MKVTVFPDFFQAYVPAPVHPLPRSRSKVIVFAVDVYCRERRAARSAATVYVPPLANVRAHVPLSWAGLLIVVAYVPDSPPAASATDETASAADGGDDDEVCGIGFE